MPSALPMAIRHEIVRRRLDGQGLAQVALQLGISYHTVRQIWRTFRQRGHGGLSPRYQNCGRPSAATEVVARACALKAAHPHWGAPVVRIELARALGLDVGDLPAARTLQTAFRAAQVYPPRRPRRPRVEPTPRATRPHEVWQVDAVEKAALADGRLASWMAVVDEATGALLDAELSPPPNDGRRSPPLRPASCFVGPLAAGACPSGFGSTTAIPGARRATCPPSWRCGWWGWGSCPIGIPPDSPGSIPRSNGPTA